MLRRILLYSLAGFVGAGLTGGAAYTGFQMGWLPLHLSREVTPQDQEAARGTLFDHLTTACGTDAPLRGALVQKVDVVEGRAVIAGLAESDEQARALEAAAAAFLKEKDWAYRFPAGAPTAQTQIYPLHSQYLPELRRQFAGSAARGPQGVVLTRTRLDDLLFGKDAKVRVQGVSLVPESRAKADDVRTLLAQEVHAFLQKRPAPGPWVPLVEAKEVKVIASPVAFLTRELGKDPRFANVYLANPSYSAEGVLRLEGVVAKPEQSAPAIEFVRGKLQGHEALRPGAGGDQGALSLSLQVVDVPALATSLRSFCASSEKPLLQRTWLEKGEIRHDATGDGLVLRWEGVCIQPGMTEQDKKELARLLTEESRKAFGKVAVEIDVAGVQARDNPALEFQGLVRKRPGLRGVLVNLVRFSDKGSLVIDYLFASDEQKKQLDELARSLKSVKALQSKAAPAPEGDKEGEEEADDDVEDDKPDKKAETEKKPTPLQSITAEIQALLAKEDDLRSTRIDGLDLDYDAKGNVEVVVSGVNIRAADDMALPAVRKEEVDKKLLDLLKKEIPERYRKQVKDAAKLTFTVRFASEANAADKEAGSYFRVLVNPIPAWQNELSAQPEFDGLLLKAAVYDAKGALQLTGLVAGDKQKEEVNQRLEKLRGDAKTAVILGPLERKDPDKLDSPLEVRPRFSPAGLVRVQWDAWRQGVQEDLASSAGKMRSLNRATRLDRLVWVYKGAIPRIVAHGVVLHPGEKDKLLEDVKGGLAEKLQERFEKEKEPAGVSKPLVEATGIQVFPSPVQALRVRAVKDGALAGAVFAEAFFDAKGQLKLSGIAASEAQRKQVRTSVEETLKADKALPEKGTADLDGMRIINNRWLATKLQEVYAGSDQPLFRQTRLDLSEFRYHQMGKEDPLLQLHVEGVCLTPPTSAKILRERLLKDANAELPLTPPLSDANLNTGKMEFVVNPARTLQERIRPDDGLRGTLFTDARYTRKGDLQIDALIPNQKLKPAIEKQIQSDELKKAIRTPPGEERKVIPIVKQIEWKSEKVKDWPTFLKALQVSLSEGKGEAGRIPRQTRIDGAFFTYEKDREKPVLVLEGVTLFDSRLLLADNKELVNNYNKEKDEEARAKLLKGAVEKSLRKPTQDEIRKHLLAESQKVLPAGEYEAGVEGIEFLESPYESLQHRLKRTGVLLTGFEFDGEGRLLPLSALELTPVRWNLILQAMRKYGPAKLVPSARTAEDDKSRKTISRRDAAGLYHTALRAAAPPGAALSTFDALWLAQVQAWQKQLSTSSDVLLRQTRLDQASLDYDESGKALLVFEGCHLGVNTDRGPLAARLEALTKDSLRLGKSYRATFDPRAFRFAPDPVLALQMLVVSRNLDGLLFHNARYDARGTLLMDVLLGSDGQQADADDVLKVRPIPEDVLAPKESELEPRLKVGPSRTFNWQRMLKEVREQFAGTADNFLARHTRLDRAFFAYGKDSADLELRWLGVCIHSSDDGAAVLRAGIAKRIEDCRGQLPPVRFTVVTAGVALQDNPTRALQQGLLTIDPTNDGILFEDAWYPADGRLQMHVLLADRSQLKIVDEVLRDNPIAAHVIAVKPRETMHPLVVRTFDLRAIIRGLQKRLAVADGIVGRIRVDRGWFTYPPPPVPRDVVQFHLGGVLLGPITPELKKDVEDKVNKETPPTLPRIPASRVQVRPEMVVRPNPTRNLQELVAATPALDGVGINDAFFEPDGKLVLVGIWRSEVQQPGLHKLAANFLMGDRLVTGPTEFLERCKPIRTQEVLADLRQWTADTQDEIWIERLYFDKDGVLTIRGVVAHLYSERPVRRTLIRLINEHPQLKGFVTVATIAAVNTKAGKKLTAATGLRPVAFRPPAPLPPPVTEPRVDLRSRPPVIPFLRRLVQWPTNPRRAGPSRRWDGIVFRRAYYATDGKFGLEGLCDSARQRNDMRDLMRVLGEENPYRTAFIEGLDMSRLRALPLAPMLRGLRKIMPAYPLLDGITLESACHDIDNRLVLRLVVVGPRPEPVVAEFFRRQIASDERWRDRVSPDYLRLLVAAPGGAGALRLDVVERLRRDDGVAEPLLLKAISTLRRGVGDESTRYCQDMDPVRLREYRLAHADEALSKLNIALQYETRDAAAWYLRALTYHVRGETQLVERDLRRMVEIEMDEPGGRNRRLERLRMTEHLQGDFRRELEILRRRIYKEVVAGRPPLMLPDVP